MSASDLLLLRRQEITRALRDEPYSLLHYLQRARVHADMGYPDLAVMDAYKVLLLADEVTDESGEFHDQALASIQTATQDASSSSQLGEALSLPSSTSSRGEDSSDAIQHAYHTLTVHQGIETLVHDQIIPRTSLLLARYLATIGCLRSAYQYAENAANREQAGISHEARTIREEVLRRVANTARANNETRDRANIDIHSFPDRGFVRREVYPWNAHERDRLAPESLNDLNNQLAVVAPKLEAKVTELPVLTTDSEEQTCRQFGLFTRHDIQPGEIVLRERSMLTASARLHEPACDACCGSLPSAHGSDLSSASVPGHVACPDCDDVVFCSQVCLDMAQASYHTSICGADVDAIAKDVPDSEAVDALYTQLLFRSLAMSYTQNSHPLDLPDVKYIWGDFNTIKPGAGGDEFAGQSRTLPFDFRSQVLQPLHFLELLDVNIFEAPNDLAETWVYNTLFAKFRGTASARMNPRTGRPEVAAVHPLWCLANHSCDPNVQWEWSGEIVFTARSQNITWRRKGKQGTLQAEKNSRACGICKGQQIFNHYVDIDLDVANRREWGAGALGGFCQCQRCLWESDPTDGASAAV
ncbi:MAG: hypothetical protein Q9162_007902 [Coniocarpon cinnabarinum]